MAALHLYISTGDSRGLIIPMKKDGAAFAPDVDSGALILTVKHSYLDPDDESVIQKATGAGIEWTGSNATVTLLRADTLTLAAKDYYLELLWQDADSLLSQPVAAGLLTVDQRLTREQQTTVPVITTEDPLPFAGSGGAWGGITGDIEDQDDLAAALDAKANADASNVDPADWTGTVTESLQGAESDPTKIGTEYLPDKYEPIYIRPSESLDGIYPIGAITRKGAIPFYHDNVIPGGIKIGGAATSKRASGNCNIIPYGTTVNGVASKLRYPGIGSYYFQEMGRVTLPAAEVAEGRRLSVIAYVKMISSSAVANNSAYMFLFPAKKWDTPAPVGGEDWWTNYTSVGATGIKFIPIRTDGTCLSSECRLAASYKLQASNIVRVSGVPDSSADGMTVIGTYGTDITNSTPFTQTNIGTLIDGGVNFPLLLGEDMEFVVVHRCLIGSARQIIFDLSIDTTPL